jgi:hypothetical protein
MNRIWTTWAILMLGYIAGMMTIIWNLGFIPAFFAGIVLTMDANLLRSWERS